MSPRDAGEPRPSASSGPSDGASAPETSRSVRRRPALIAGLVVAVAVAAVSITLAVRRDERRPTPVTTARPRPTPHFTPAFEVKLARVEATPVARGARKRSLRAAVRGVRATMTRLYTTAFIDPSQWRGGRFPGLTDHFFPAARGQVRRDVRELTLGRDAAHLSSVRPDRTRLEIRFLVGLARRPVAAVATMELAGRGFREGERVARIRHRGRYLLRPRNGEWLVSSYQVRRDVRPAGDVELPQRKDPLFILAIGSDARPGQGVANARADSLHIIGVNTRRGIASILGIPRDSYVPIPGHGNEKINAALFLGGPELQVRTVEQLTGIDIDAYLLTGFDGFKKLVSAIGSVEVDIPYAMNDPESGARFSPGPTRLDAQEALAFARNRHDAPGGDFGRSMNQGRLIVAAFRRLREQVVRDPAAVFRWIVSAFRNTQTNLSLDEMLELLVGALTIDAQVENRVVSGSGGFVGSQSVVRLGSSAQRQFADLRRDGILRFRR